MVKAGALVADALIVSKLATSKREAKQFLKDRAVILNAEVIADDKRKLEASDFHMGLALLKRGKRNVCVLQLEN